MAKFKYYEHVEVIAGNYEGDLQLQVNNKGTSARWTDDVTEAEIIVKGKNLEVDSESSQLLSSGKITSITFTGPDGEKTLTIENLNVKATQLQAANESGGAEGVLEFLTKGNDRVVGTSGDDYLIGWAGNDEMTGKAGSDTFVFAAPLEINAKAKPARDVITDFETAPGDDMDYLEIYQDFEVSKANKGKDTLLTFSDDSTLLLEGVKRAEFNEYWENMQNETFQV